MSIDLSIDAGRAILRLNRPDKRNAMSREMWQLLGAHLAQIATDRGIRLLLLEGAGEHFCSGADLSELAERISDRNWMLDNHADVQATTQALYRLPVPTIAVIRGSCVGGGLGLATACDFRIASLEARFAITPAKLGLGYSLEDSRRLLDLVGPAQARRLLLTGEMITAREAERIGLVQKATAIDALNAELNTLIDMLLANATSAQVAIKRTLLTLGDGVRADDALSRSDFASLFEGPDFAEGAAAFLERRPPRFSA